MPTVNDVDIDFDSMSDEQLEAYLAELREISKTRKPRAGASIKNSFDKPARAPKQPKKDVIKIEL